ncbi:MAG: alpha/beta hydrolase [Bacteroidaceae bacterium]|nr:alpha/beta hydrolase [Bacteroidaceae bacterium]
MKPASKKSTQKKPISSKKKHSSPTLSKRRPPRFGFCLLELLAATLLFVVVIVFGISYFVFQQAVCPNTWGRTEFCNSSLSDEESLAIMYSDYPFVKRWLKRQRSNNRFREFTIYSDTDSTLLHSYYIPAEQPTANTALVIHGYQSKALEMLHIAYLYHHDMQFNVLLPDLRTHGKSGGTHIGFGWTEAQDILQWMSETEKMSDAPVNWVVHGISMGAATTMFVADKSNNPNVKAYIEDCGYSSVFDEIAYVAQRDYGMSEAPCVTLASQICQWVYGWNFREASCAEALRNVETPMLFIHGTADRYVPFDMVHDLYNAKPRNKEIWEVKDVIHARSYHDRRDEYTKKVSDFVNQFLYTE